MRGLARKRWVAGAVGLALAGAGLAACGSDDTSDPAAAGSVKVFSCKPQNPLIPSNTNEVCGGDIIDNVFTGLVVYDPDTAQPINAVATSIESSDNTTWTVKLTDKYTFSDGTKVTADSFVNAWNWSAYGPNAQANSYFFSSIEGYDALNPADPDENPETDNTPKPATDKMTGLTVVSPTEFTIKLTTPQSSLPVQLGYTAFYPLPESFYSDTVAFGKKPVGNGPFAITAGTPDKGFTLEAVDSYAGPDQPKVKSIFFKTYRSDTSAYADMQDDKLDLMNQVPAAALVRNQYQKDFPGRFVNKSVGVIQTATLPQYIDNYDDANLGKALSLAIDRKTITEKIYNGGRTPATGWVSPVVQGYKAGACDPYCTYDPEQAKSFLAKAKYKGPFSYAYNSDGPGNAAAAAAICNSIKIALDVECTPKAYVDFDTFRTAVVAKEMTSMFRTGWQMDWPAMDNFLAPLYVTGASANDGGYSNKEFDDLITKAAGQSGDEAIATYQEAERVLSEQMAIIPLWYQAQQSVWSTNVADVKVTPFSTFDLTTVTLSASAGSTPEATATS
jgi:oligopeptide transport system substrate-binding protein